MLDSCLYTTPGKFGAGGAWTTWLVGSHDEVAAALRRYQDLGITHFVLSDTPYRHEVVRVGDQLLQPATRPGCGLTALRAGRCPECRTGRYASPGQSGVSGGMMR